MAAVILLTPHPKSNWPARSCCISAPAPGSGSAAAICPTDRYLGASRIRELAAELALRPTKTLGQNFVHDANTVRRIVARAELAEDDVVLEVGPGLGSLTLGLLDAGHQVVAVEIDQRLATLLPRTIQERQPEHADALQVVCADALTLDSPLPPQPTAMVANLPYNISVPVLLHLLRAVPSLQRVLVMVQSEVADRLAAPPGSKTYGVPSAKVAWYAHAQLAGSVGRRIFWPAPNVDSALVKLDRRPAPTTSVSVEQVFDVIDVAFAQRRKMLRSALGALPELGGSSADAVELLETAGVDPTARAETLNITQFAAIAAARDALMRRIRP